MRFLKGLFVGVEWRAIFWSVLIGFTIQRAFDYPVFIALSVLCAYFAVRGIVQAEMEKIDVEIRSQES